MTNIETTVPEKVYFKNLNAIRFFAALLVMVHHIESTKNLFKWPSVTDNDVVYIIGKLGVVLFFVLSGFLISYLLFREQQHTKTIHIRKFYVRRILRIWPLYFLIILLSFFLFPHTETFTLPGYSKAETLSNLGMKIVLFVFFLPNMALSLYRAVPFASITWSIGAEEQFYLAWPVMNKLIRNRWLIVFGVIVFYLAVKLTLLFMPVKHPLLMLLERFWAMAPIDCMAIGGLFALFVHEKGTTVTAIRKILFSAATQWITLLLVTVLIAAGVEILVMQYEFYAILFGILISNFAANENRIFSMENKVTIYLGKISYGLYMYHPIAIVLAIRLLGACGLPYSALLYPLAIGLTIVFAGLSYRFYEKWFIDRKVRYSDIISGEHARP